MKGCINEFMKCRVCGGSNLELCIDLGNQPWCNNFLQEEDVGKEPTYPLRVVFCHDCTAAQLDYTVKKEIMFGDHTYLSGITQSLSDHFKQVAAKSYGFYLEQKKERAARVLDIGSNDGTQLKHFQDLSCECVGVESSISTASIANKNGIFTINKFFNLDVAEEINQKFDIINASGVFFHLEELHSVCEGIKLLLDDDGVFKVQFLYIKNIIDNCAFDQIYHEHLLYYSLRSLSELLDQYNLEIFDAYLAKIHGGSIIASVCHKGRFSKTKEVRDLEQLEESCNLNTINTYKRFAKKIEEMKERDLQFLEEAIENGKLIYGFGAPVKGNTLLNYYNINSQTISLLVEKNNLRKNLYSPGSHIKVVLESELVKQPDIYYVLAWNFKNEILKNNSHLIEKGVEFYFPVNPL